MQWPQGNQCRHSLLPRQYSTDEVQSCWFWDEDFQNFPGCSQIPYILMDRTSLAQGMPPECPLTFLMDILSPPKLWLCFLQKRHISQTCSQTTTPIHFFHPAWAFPAISSSCLPPFVLPPASWAFWSTLWQISAARTVPVQCALSLWLI